MQGIRGISGKRGIRPPPAILAPDKMPSAGLPPEVRQWAAKMGERMARIIWRLKQSGVQGSAPELIVYHELERKLGKQPSPVWFFQSSQFGGRQWRYGLVVDFVILIGAGVGCIRVQGTYWHSVGESEQQDKAHKFRLLRSKIMGRKVIFVADVWENAVYKHPSSVVEDALHGRDSAKG